MEKLKELERALAANRISRRDFLTQATALAGGAALSTALVSGAALAAPKRGGTVKIGCSGANTSDSWDGGTHSDIFMQMAAHGMVFDCLTEVRADGSLAGELAESWEASDDATIWTFKLKRGVEFHNGKSFGADDVIESLQHHVSEDSKSAAKPIVAAIQDMKKDDQHTVTFTLKNGNADFPYLLSDYHILIYPAGMKDEAIRKGIGTGGYVSQNFEPGVRLDARRFDNHHKPDSCYFDSVEMLAINDPNARQTALVTGQVHVINRIDLKTAHLLERNRDIEIFEVTGNQHFSYPMHTNKAPFDNNHVRQALKYAFDREQLVKKILRGRGIPGNDHPIGPANQYWHRDLEQRSYDPDKAKFHLQKAGLDSLTVDVSASEAAFGGAVDATVLYKETAAKCSININVIREPEDGYWSNVWLKKPYVACFWSGRATEDWMFSTAYESGVPWNDSFWDHERFNKLLVEARATLDDSKRRELYYEMQVIVRDEGGVAIPMYANWVDANSKKLAHGKDLGNLWQLDGARLAERWWFA